MRKMRKKQRLYKCDGCNRTLLRDVPSLQNTFSTYKSYCEKEGKDVVLKRVISFWPIVKTYFYSKSNKVGPLKVGKDYLKLKHIARVFNNRRKN